MKDELESAERFQRLFVTPLVDGVRKELNPIVKGQQDLTQRVSKLEAMFGRAVWGLSIASAVMSVVLGVGLDYIKRKLGLSHK